MQQCHPRKCCCCLVTESFVSPWAAACQAPLSMGFPRQEYWNELPFPSPGDLPDPGIKLMSIELVMPSSHLILCHPPLLLPSILPSIRVFSNESVLRITWPKYWSFSFNTYHSNEFAGLIFFRIDQLDVQGMLKLLLQHHNSKASVL